MGFLRRIAAVLGFVRGDDNHGIDGSGDSEEEDRTDREAILRRHRKGFSVQVPVAVDRHLAGPVIAPCNPGEGGVQGLKWYANRLRMDEDGDIADEFLDEVFPDQFTMDNQRHHHFPKFQSRRVTQPAIVRGQTISTDGNVRQSVVQNGLLRWV
ncbi:hypothetical protein QJS04_geneDACA008796 [Acorus gramineus]|uniref:Uncharacterized protein n=1 Tax=Acorus gramineus TaxID=55184 RepID=A0AAV9ABG9_ACOGR|nr:hypothetical protein QJS04_geneDACA008796 [Acorus gramineus]